MWAAEMVFPWMFEGAFEQLLPLQQTANTLAEKEWGPLYNLTALESTSVGILEKAGDLELLPKTWILNLSYLCRRDGVPLDVRGLFQAAGAFTADGKHPGRKGVGTLVQSGRPGVQ
jgi:hypothetical protein